MGYIVDALITNHHFELLLQKDMENVSRSSVCSLWKLVITAKYVMYVM